MGSDNNMSRKMMMMMATVPGRRAGEIFGGQEEIYGEKGILDGFKLAMHVKK